MIRRELLWGSNRETFRNLLGKESIVAWSWTHYHEYREKIPRRLAAAQEAGTDIVILKNRRQTRRFLATL